MDAGEATRQAQQRMVSMEELESVLDEILSEYAGFHVRYAQGARDTVEQVRIRLGISVPKALEQLELRRARPTLLLFDSGDPSLANEISNELGKG